MIIFTDIIVCISICTYAYRAIRVQIIMFSKKKIIINKKLKVLPILKAVCEIWSNHEYYYIVLL